MCAIFSRTQENMNLKKEMGDPKKKENGNFGDEK